MRKWFFAAFFVVCCLAVTAQQTLNNDAIVKLVKAGLSDDLIVTTINAQSGSYDTSADGIIALKAAGASDKVVAAIVTKVSGTAQAPAPPQQPSAPRNDAAPEVPPEPNSPGTAEPPEEGTASGTAPIPAGARIVIAPMGGFETYFAAAIREKKVPVKLTLERASSQFFVVSTNTEWEGFVYGSGANWSRSSGSAGSAASSTRGLEASIMIIDAKTKDVVWAYEVHKNSHGSLFFGTLGARGQQSIAEACAKHLKVYIEKGK